MNLPAARATLTQIAKLIRRDPGFFRCLCSELSSATSPDASAQKLEHYGTAAYGTAAALAGQLDLRDEQKMLHSLTQR